MKIHFLKYCQILLILFLQIAIVNKAFAQEQYYVQSYSHLPFVKETVTKIYQDNDGYMWFATFSGVYRYDGMNVLEIEKDRNINMETALCFLQDKKKNIWLSTYSGLYKVVGKKLIKFNQINKLFKNPFFFNLREDSQGNIWAMGRSNLVSFSSNGDTLHTKVYDTKSKSVFDMVEVENGSSILFASLGGLYSIRSDTLFPQIMVKDNRNVNIFHIYSTKGKDLYFHNNFLYKSTHLYSTNLVGKFGDQYLSGILASGNENNIIVGDYNGTYAEIFVNGKLIYRFDKYLGKDILVNAVYATSEDSYWVGTFGGLYQITPIKTSIQGLNVNSIHNSKIQSINGHADGSIYLLNLNYQIGTVDENDVKVAWSAPVLSKTLRSAYPNANPYLLVVDSLKTNAYISSSYIGPVRYNKKNENSKVLAPQPKGLESSYGIVAKEVGQKVIIGGFGYAAIILGDSTKYFIDSPLNRMVQCQSIIQFRNSDTCLIGSNKGLFLLANNKISEIVFRDSSNISATEFQVFPRNKDTLWVIIKDYGIYYLYQKDKIWNITPFITEQNCKQDIKSISGMIDNMNRLWVKFSNQPMEWLVVEKPGGGYYFRKPLAGKMKEKNLYMGADMFSFAGKYFVSINDSAIYKFDISNDSIFAPVRKIVIGNLDIKNLNDSLLNFTSGNNPAFTYSQNSIKFYFSVLGFGTESYPRFEYYLKGSDEKEFENITDVGYANYNNLSPGNYTFYVREISNFDKDGNLPVASFSFEILPPWYSTWWAYTLWALLAIALLYGLFRWRLNAFKEKVAMEKLVVDSELKALRAQLNPHFVQNTFNLMAKYVKNGHIEESVETIKTVAGYIRQVLYQSERNVVTLEEELDYTKEYLDMQQMLHPGLFNYELNIDDRVDTFGLEVPSMILQPVVENCIKHGFSDMDSDGLIQINAMLHGNMLNLEVLDNGKGFNTEIKEEGYQSKGLDLTRKRLLLMLGKNAGQTLHVAIGNRNDGKGSRFIILYNI